MRTYEATPGPSWSWRSAIAAEADRKPKGILGRHCVRGVYREIAEGERLVYDDFCHEDGKLFHQAL